MDPSAIGKPDDVYSNPSTVGSQATILSSHSEDDDDFRVRYGWLNIRPNWLQFLRNTKWLLFWLSCGATVQGMMTSGVVSCVISTLEKRFSLNSTTTGIIVASFDVGSFLLLLPVSYLGDKGNKPRWLAYGILIMGVGAFIFSIPQYAAGKYVPDQEVDTICHPGSNSTSGNDDNSNTGISNYKFIFIFAQLLFGAGAAPLYSLGVTYIDDAVKRTVSSVYLGIYYSMAVVGPAIGFLVTGQFLDLYVDIYNNQGLSPSSSVWVGAWWLGFLVCSAICFIIVLPILGLPFQFPGHLKRKLERQDDDGNGDPEDSAMSSGFGNSLSELPAALKRLLSNPTYLFLSLGAASEGVIINGNAAFLPKFMQSQFNLTASWAAMLVGLVIVPAGGGGTFLGGYLVKRFSLKCAGILKLMLCLIVVSLLSSSVFFIKCKNVNFAGVNYPYAANDSDQDLNPGCISDCHCNMQMFDPVCGVNNVMYYSACHAGCQQPYDYKDTRVFTNCSCIDGHPHNVTLADGETVSALAFRDTCSTDCNLLPLFVCILFVLMITTFVANIMILSATLRSVEDDQRSLALGIQWQMVRIFGTIPAPIIYGAAIDRTCSLWETGGSCRFYDNNLLSWLVLGVSVVVKSASSIFFFLAWWTWRSKNKKRR